MNSVLAVFDVVLAFLRPTLAALAGAVALVLAIDWLVRTRRLNPFGPIPRFFRSVVDPMLLPIERRVVRLVACRRARPGGRSASSSSAGSC